MRTVHAVYAGDMQCHYARDLISVHSHSSILAALLRQCSPPEVNNADEDDSVSFSKEHDDDREEGSGLLLYCLYLRRALPSSRAIIGVHIPPLGPQTVTDGLPYRHRSVGGVSTRTVPPNPSLNRRQSFRKPVEYLQQCLILFAQSSATMLAIASNWMYFERRSVMSIVYRGVDLSLTGKSVKISTDDCDQYRFATGIG
ncbi:hypothetical protein E4U52_006941 [Claviceps spartinae]|nr:hypothetical protein E4U52_006941 [Claviceps spartinae]